MQKRLFAAMTLRLLAWLVAWALGIIAPAWAITGAQELLLFGGGSKVAASVVFTLPDGATGTGIACKTFASCFASSRASNATMLDSTGATTFGPNNLITNSGNIGAWIKGPGISIASGATDPFGGANAFTATASGSSAFNVNNYVYTAGAKPAGVNIIQSIWIRRRTGTGTVSITNPNAAQNNVTLTGAWQQVQRGPGPGATTTAYLQVDVLTSGDQVDVYNGTMSTVTYETLLSQRPAGDQTVTTSNPYYGPRLDYTGGSLAGLLEEPARTNLFLNSGSPATQTITVANASPYCVGFYGTGTVTLSGALTQVMSGTGASVQTTYCGTTATTSLVATVAGSITYPQVEAGAYPTSPIVTGTVSFNRAVDVPAAVDGFATALHDGVSIWAMRDEATGVVACSAVDKNSATYPVGKNYRFIQAFKPAVSLGAATSLAASMTSAGKC